MKKIKFFILLCLFGMISIGAGAISNNTIYYTTTDGNIVKPYNKYIANTNIVSNIYSDGQGIITFDSEITKIYDYSFQKCINLKSIILPSTVTSIGSQAFSECENLESVDIPNSVNTIESSAFSGCTSLTSINLPTSLTSIKGSTFNACSSLRSITIPSEVTSIESTAFNNCFTLESITIPNSVTEIGYSAFSGCYFTTQNLINESGLNAKLCEYWGAKICDNILENGLCIKNNSVIRCRNINQDIEIPSSVTSIGSNAFIYCTKLKNISIPNTIISIGGGAFSYCTNLRSVVIPSSVSSINTGLFSECTNLTSVVIPNTIKTIGSYTFSGCTSLSHFNIPNSISTIGSNAFEYSGLINVDIPSSVTTIEYYAFKGCKNLAKVTLPNSIETLGSGAFNNCAGLVDVYVMQTTPMSIDYNTTEMFDIFSKKNITNAILHVPVGTIPLYESAKVWKDFGAIVEIVENPNITIIRSNNSCYEAAIVANDELSLEDDIKSIEVTEQVKDVTITYTRNFENAGVWQAWYMPFDVDFDDMKGAYDVAQIHGVLLDKDKNAVLAFLKLDEGTVKANTPYVVRPKKSGEVAITTTTDLLPTQSNSFLMMSATDKYTIGGVFEQTTTPGNWYALNLDGQFQLMGSGVYLRPFRIYMTIDPRKDNPYATSVSANAKMDIVVLGDDETTGIKESLTPTLSEGEGAIYNLNGQRVTSIKSGQIYIMNGKKYIAK